ncbi:site-2 protease family protein [Rhizobium halophytocola]|uniref:Peptidase M50 domain-containing protein n=1 Tax=Rhizobium halophytocola TaxID=735519 RepID=A0ABS4E630_9HYPH|nr:site-2 protease family protein [Rhizobium halophytocola]MBP1853402.1 hypothetical protein [Rhizobium halophytocola]
MDLPRLTLLRQVELHASSEGRRALFLARDRSNGKIFTIPRALAAGLCKAKVAMGQPGAPPDLSNAGARDIYGFLHMLESVRKSETAGHRKFNPVFMSFSLLDLSAYQARLMPLAQLIVAPGFLLFFLCLAIFSGYVGTQNGWQALESFKSVFSLEAILTFGLFAPLLKVIHELGHVLAATRYGVQVQNAGVNLIAFYPMPFVDCTDADFSARRRHRVIISLAGIGVDLTIGMLAFIAWHFTEGSYVQTLLGNVYVFCTLNSILFNGNPLVKLDGYFAFADAIGNRNLYTSAQARFSGLLKYLTSFGAIGTLPGSGTNAFLACYAAATIVYRIHMLTNIAWGLAPRYLGGGTFLVAWAAIAMFHTPVVALARNAIQKPLPQARSVWLKRGLALGAVIAFALLVPLPFNTVVPVSIAAAENYSVTAASNGFLDYARDSGNVRAGDRLFSLTSPQLQDEHAGLVLDVREALLAFQSLRGDDQSKAQAALRQISDLKARLDIVETSISQLSIHASRDGIFVRTTKASKGEQLIAGAPLGQLLPEQGHSVFAGDFPEQYVAKFQQGLTGADLRLDTRHNAIDPATVHLQQIMSYDQASGTRSYRIQFPLAMAPAAIAGAPGDIRLSFASGTLFDHVRFAFDALIANYRQAQLSDQHKYLQD